MNILEALLNFISSLLGGGKSGQTTTTQPQPAEGDESLPFNDPDANPVPAGSGADWPLSDLPQPGVYEQPAEAEPDSDALPFGSWTQPGSSTVTDWPLSDLPSGTEYSQPAQPARETSAIPFDPL